MIRKLTTLLAVALVAVMAAVAETRTEVREAYAEVYAPVDTLDFRLYTNAVATIVTNPAFVLGAMGDATFITASTNGTITTSTNGAGVYFVSFGLAFRANATTATRNMKWWVAVDGVQQTNLTTQQAFGAANNRREEAGCSGFLTLGTNVTLDVRFNHPQDNIGSAQTFRINQFNLNAWRLHE